MTSPASPLTLPHPGGPKCLPPTGQPRSDRRRPASISAHARDRGFVALGPVRYVTHTGERPMGITWKLETPMPAALFERFAALLAA